VFSLLKFYLLGQQEKNVSKTLHELNSHECSRTILAAEYPPLDVYTKKTMCHFLVLYPGENELRKPDSCMMEG
jgi:hypothetical protein